MKYYIKAIKNYAVFEGRSTRKEFWMFVLFNILISFVLGFVSAMLGDVNGVVSTIYSLFILLPAISISVRRLHDVNMSGWFYFIAIVPFIGWAFMIVVALIDSTVGPNNYGLDPKEKDRIIDLGTAEIVEE